MDFGQCYVTKNNELPADDGEIAFVRAPVTHLLNQLIDLFNKRNLGKSGATLIPNNHEFLLAQFPCRIKYIDSLHGKVPESAGEMISFEHDKYLSLLSYYLPEPLHEQEYAEFHQFLREPYLLDQFAD